MKNANFTNNRALWGGAVASFSSGGSGGSASSTSTALESGSFLSSASGYDPYDLTPSLTTAGDGTTVTSLVGSGSGSGSGSVPASPVRYLDCTFESNLASEDGGAICKL